MISGPLSMRLVRELLGKTDAAMKALVLHEGFPVVRLPGESETLQKVYFLPLLKWINGQAINEAMTEEQLEAELERCQRAIEQRDASRRATREALRGARVA